MLEIFITCVQKLGEQIGEGEKFRRYDMRQVRLRLLNNAYFRIWIIPTDIHIR